MSDELDLRECEHHVRRPIPSPEARARWRRDVESVMRGEPVAWERPPIEVLTGRVLVLLDRLDVDDAMHHPTADAREAHVRLRRVGDGTTWCGLPLNGWRWDFVDVSHLAHHRLNGGRLLPCPDCLRVIMEALQSQ